MRILANENVAGEAVRALRDRGHDVVWAREDAPGSSDAAVLSRAQTEGRIVVTFDKGFGELAFGFGLRASSGIVLFRTAIPSSLRVAALVVAALEARADWAGHFAVVEEHRVRMTPLPGLGEEDP
jgi:predicted nuclease of predicted toxin-antitoxin system